MIIKKLPEENLLVVSLTNGVCWLLKRNNRFFGNEQRKKCFSNIFASQKIQTKHLDLCMEYFHDRRKYNRRYLYHTSVRQYANCKKLVKKNAFDVYCYGFDCFREEDEDLQDLYGFWCYFVVIFSERVKRKKIIDWF